MDKLLIKFVKGLCDLTKTLVAEKKYEDLPSDIKAKNALTELFLEIKSDKTPKIIDEIVKKIDEVVTVLDLIVGKIHQRVFLKSFFV